MILPRILLCRDGCCPALSFTDGGGAFLAGLMSKGEAVVEGDLVGVRLSKDNLQKLANTLSKAGILPDSSDTIPLEPANNL